MFVSGPAPSGESYLNIPNIISAAEVSDAEAIHPGLRISWPKTLNSRGSVATAASSFIGPPAEVVEKMGDKAEAKRTAQAAGVPVIPGSEGPVATVDAGLAAARECGFPVFIKAGGGRRRARDAAPPRAPQEFEASFSAASSGGRKRGSATARSIVEKTTARSEACGIPDHGGQARPCRACRRHGIAPFSAAGRNWIEETPCVALPPDVRERMAQAAVVLARHSRLCRRRHDRIPLGPQRRVLFHGNEHPSSSRASRHRSGHPVGPGQGSRYPWPRGKSCRECRKTLFCRAMRSNAAFNAEDPERNFTPSPGKISTYHPPGGSGVRIDSHIYQEYVGAATLRFADRQGDRSRPRARGGDSAHDSLLGRICD